MWIGAKCLSHFEYLHKALSRSGVTSLEQHYPDWFSTLDGDTRHGDEVITVPLPDLLTSGGITLSDWVSTIKKQTEAPSERIAAFMMNRLLCKESFSPLSAQFTLLHLEPAEGVNGVDLTLSPEGVTATSLKGLTTTPHSELWHEVGHLLQQWCHEFQRSFGISKPVFWSNAALAIASPWARFAAYTDEPVFFAREAQQFLNSIHPTLAYGVLWHQPVSPNQCQIKRQACCLKYILQEGDMCGTCSRHAIKHPIDIE